MGWKYLRHSFAGCLIISLHAKGWLTLVSEGGDSPSDRFFLGLWFGSLWLCLLYSLRTVRAVGIRFLPIFTAVQSTGTFFVIVSFVLSAAITTTTTAVTVL